MCCRLNAGYASACKVGTAGPVGALSKTAACVVSKDDQITLWRSCSPDSAPRADPPGSSTTLPTLSPTPRFRRLSSTAAVVLYRRSATQALRAFLCLAHMYSFREEFQMFFRYTKMAKEVAASLDRQVRQTPCCPASGCSACARRREVVFLRGPGMTSFGGMR